MAGIYMVMIVTLLVLASVVIMVYVPGLGVAGGILAALAVLALVIVGLIGGLRQGRRAGKIEQRHKDRGRT